MKRRPYRGYFPEPSKSLFILDTPVQEDAARREFVAEGIVINSVTSSRYFGVYLGPQEELEEWLKPQVEAWAHGVIVLVKIAQQHPQMAYAGLGVLFQLEWYYLHITVLGVGTLMGPIEEALREKFFPALFWGGKRSTPTFGKS